MTCQVNILVYGRSGGDYSSPSIFGNYSRACSKKPRLKLASKLIFMSSPGGRTHESLIGALISLFFHAHTCSSLSKVPKGIRRSFAFGDLSNYQKPKTMKKNMCYVFCCFPTSWAVCFCY
ncbi:hypothetical protein V6Z11_A08G191000 [Gossypium hirsutum]